MASGDWQSAARAVERAPERDRSLPESRYLTGVFRAREGDSVPALRDLAGVLEVSPCSGSCWYWVGVCLERLGYVADAAAAYSASADSPSPDPRARAAAARASAAKDVVSSTGRALARHEPAAGCYVGAYLPAGSADELAASAAKLASATGREHASYITYVSYGRPFPEGWVRRAISLGAAPHIALEPQGGLEAVRDDAYLEEWARKAGAAGGPIFLRFASEMNGNWDVWGEQPRLYREKFRAVANVLRKHAPNVAMVWTIFERPLWNIEDYYPGDDVVDWVGVNIYSVYCHDGEPWRICGDEDPAEFLRPIYDRYAARKPIQVSEYAATHRCYGTGKELGAWAAAKLTRLYGAIRTEFPRVKGINWFCCDPGRTGRAHNDYSLLTDPSVLSAYKRVVADPYWLSAVGHHWRAPEPFLVPRAPNRRAVP
jgi:hypothetical protein